jgi:formamidopyrimidine-DNA glycosylase
MKWVDVPEGLEAELYRRAAEVCIGRTIVDVTVDDRVNNKADLRSSLPGLTVTAARRTGKVVFLDTSSDGAPGPTLGLHFGMTGRFAVDGHAPIDKLEYGSERDDPEWDRFAVEFADGGGFRVNDPRRLAKYRLDRDEEELGPDFLSITPDELSAVLRDRRAAVKAVLLDQTAISGFGNLCIDEVLWQAGISPYCNTRDMSDRAIELLHASMLTHLPKLLARGGSNMGTLGPELRMALGACPRDGRPLRSDHVAGRTTVWCPHHQTF